MAGPEEGLAQAAMTRLILPYTRGEWTSHAVRGKSLANPHDCEGIHGRPGIRCLLTWPASDCQGMREGATRVCEENGVPR